MEEIELGTVITHLLNEPHNQQVDKKFSNPDINYLLAKTGLDHKTVGRAIRIFGEAAVVESLRRHQPDWTQRYWWGVCKRVAGGEPTRHAAADSTAGLQSPPASQGEI